MNQRRFEYGFTLVELIIIMALFSMVAAFSFPYFRSQTVQYQLEASSDELYGMLRQAQSRAMSGYNASSWGIHWDTDTYTLFSGDDYDTRDTIHDQVIPLAPSITIHTTVSVSGALYPEDVVFHELTGTTDADGIITIVSSISDTQQYSVEPQGQIERE